MWKHSVVKNNLHEIDGKIKIYASKRFLINYMNTYRRFLNSEFLEAIYNSIGTSIAFSIFINSKTNFYKFKEIK